jgi:hypothetical protein
MYITIRKYTGLGNLIDRLAPPVRDGLVPRLRQAPGFRGYCAFASEDGHVVSVTIFDDRQLATRANDQVREWVVANLKDMVPNPPEVMAGEVLLHKEATLQDGDPGMFATVRAYDSVGPKDEVLPMVREHTFPVITGAPGFRGFYNFLDERDASLGVSVSLYDTREHAMEANDRAVAVMRNKRIAPKPPSVMAGQTAVAAVA